MGNQFVYLHIHKGKFLFFWYRYIWNNEASVFSSLFFFAITEKIYSDRTEIMEAWQTSPWQDGYSQYGTIYMPSSGQGLISNTHSKYQQQINYINKQGKKKLLFPPWTTNWHHRSPSLRTLPLNCSCQPPFKHPHTIKGPTWRASCWSVRRQRTGSVWGGGGGAGRAHVAAVGVPVTTLKCTKENSVNAVFVTFSSLSLSFFHFKNCLKNIFK